MDKGTVLYSDNHSTAVLRVGCTSLAHMAVCAVEARSFYSGRRTSTLHTAYNNSTAQNNVSLLSGGSNKTTYTSLILFEGMEHVETMYKYNCCANTVLIAVRKKTRDFKHVSSARKPILKHANTSPRLGRHIHGR